MGDEIRVEVPAAVAVATGATVEAVVSSPIWLWWTAISKEHADRARAVAPPATANLQTLDMLPEAHASLVAITAASFALETLSQTVALLTGASGTAGTAHARIRERLHAAFGLRPDYRAADFKWLFSTRRVPAVHEGERFKPLENHPRLPTQVSPDVARFTAESADRAYALLVDVLRACIAATGGHEAAREFIAQKRPGVEGIIGLER